MTSDASPGDSRRPFVMKRTTKIRAAANVPSQAAFAARKLRTSASSRTMHQLVER